MSEYALSASSKALRLALSASYSMRILRSKAALRSISSRYAFSESSDSALLWERILSIISLFSS